MPTGHNVTIPILLLFEFDYYSDTVLQCQYQYQY